MMDALQRRLTLLFWNSPLVEIPLRRSIMMLMLFDMLRPAPIFFLKEAEERCLDKDASHAARLMINSTCVSPHQGASLNANQARCLFPL